MIDNELRSRNEVFGIPVELFFDPAGYHGPSRPVFRQNLASPLGVAAGPHAQMAQNIITAWLCGASYIELKTVQTLDELNVSKPCIDMQDEGYNCEWSQELRIHESFNEYLKAWILIHMLRHRLGQNSLNRGFVFNMSVGYNYEGIQNSNVQWFLDKMTDCRIEKNAMINDLVIHYPEISLVEIPDCISDNITLSTMHGCPPDEIEKIGHYLLREKKLHTFIKLNPTLLGRTGLRDILNNRLGFKTTVPDEAFEHDLKYQDAIGMLSRLQLTAQNEYLVFGVKLTNTLESLNHKNVFPANETMMYMSGRALHPISVNVARKLQNEFNGKLAISFSGGADCFNIADLVRCGLHPVTVCSDLLKPGGYGRLAQYTENLNEVTSGDETNALYFLNKYADTVLDNMAYMNNPFVEKNIKSGRKLGIFDCVEAPCSAECPTNQDIPEYMYHTAKGDLKTAFEDILSKNPFPNVLGSACDHLCDTKCTRINYDEPLKIRDIKLYVAENAESPEIIDSPYNGKKVAVIGAGPSGLSCAWFLRQAGFSVDIFESKSAAGGMIYDAIPSFRMKMELLYRDIERIEKSGVNIHYNAVVDRAGFEKLKTSFDFIYIGAGAQRFRMLNLAGETAKGVLNPFDFLKNAKKGELSLSGNHVLVIGGGNTAVDCARSAKRLIGDKGSVRVIYRRSRAEMPADLEEIEALLSENIELTELLSPEKIHVSEGKVVAMSFAAMRLEAAKTGERPVPVKTGDALIEFKADIIIPALGQEIDIDFAEISDLETRNNSFETRLNNVFIGGDAMRGAATIVKAVGDGRKAAAEIAAKSGFPISAKALQTDKNTTVRNLTIRKAKRIMINPDIRGFQTRLSNQQAREEASRCLLCNEICNVCVSVCPNRANTYYAAPETTIPVWSIEHAPKGYFSKQINQLDIKQPIQILNITDFCNECGNCTTFCPTSGSPFRDKPRFNLTKESFDTSDNTYFLDTSGQNAELLFRAGSITYRLTKQSAGYKYETPDVTVTFDADFKPGNIVVDAHASIPINLGKASEMKYLLDNIHHL